MLPERCAQYDFVFHVGDIGYADDAFMHDATGFEYENVYNAWMPFAASLLPPSVGDLNARAHDLGMILERVGVRLLRF